jgi:hypothetical protein
MMNRIEIEHVLTGVFGEPCAKHLDGWYPWGDEEEDAERGVMQFVIQISVGRVFHLMFIQNLLLTVIEYNSRFNFDEPPGHKVLFQGKVIEPEHLDTILNSINI